MAADEDDARADRHMTERIRPAKQVFASMQEVRYLQSSLPTLAVELPTFSTAAI